MGIRRRPKVTLKSLLIEIAVLLIAPLIIVPMVGNRDKDVQESSYSEEFMKAAEAITKGSSYVVYSFYLKDVSGTLSDEMKNEMASIILDAIASNPNAVTINKKHSYGYEVGFSVSSNMKEIAFMTTTNDYFILDEKYVCYVDKKRLDNFKSKILASKKKASAEQVLSPT